MDLCAGSSGLGMGSPGRSAAWVAALLLATLLAGCSNHDTGTVSLGPHASSSAAATRNPFVSPTVTPSEAKLDGAAPRLTVGDAWLETQTDPFNATVTLQTHVLAFEDVTVLNVTYSAVKLLQTASRNGTSGNRTIWLRQSDLAFLKLQEQYTSAAYHVLLSSPPCAGFFPYVVGKRVQRQCDFDDTVDLGSGPTRTVYTTNYTVTVEGIQRISTGAGQLDAFRIRFTPPGGATGGTTTWWAPSACYRAREQTDLTQGSRWTDLKQYACSAHNA